MRIIVNLLLALSLSSPAFAQLKYIQSDDDIRDILLGNKIMGMEKGESYVEQYLPGGTIEGVTEEERYTGHWRIEAGKICLKYEGDSVWDCTKVAISGLNIYWLDEEPKTASLIPN